MRHYIEDFLAINKSWLFVAPQPKMITFQNTKTTFPQISSVYHKQDIT